MVVSNKNMYKNNLSRKQASRSAEALEIISGSSLNQFMPDHFSKTRESKLLINPNSLFNACQACSYSHVHYKVPDKKLINWILRALIFPVVNSMCCLFKFPFKKKNLQKKIKVQVFPERKVLKSLKCNKKLICLI